MEVEVNILAVLLAAVASMIVGSIWYARPVLGATWMKLVKLDEKKAKDGALKAMSLAFAMSLLLAYVLAHVTFLSNEYFGGSFFMSAITTAFWLWLGIALTRTVTHDAFENRPLKLTAINSANQLLTMLAMGAVIGWLGN